jgi:serine protease inhibitor
MHEPATPADIAEMSRLLVEALSADTRLVLTNAIYFKGKWDSQFKKEATKSVF